ncbi:hypothetical protein [Paenibacillus taiwanensis]|uniref:hypothetical protein n=1 Tax=Paenibacillus taiwanensis TaxID=401638 RepID=UPI00040621BD|nr:hypothetical protein [Paenibacillus taiwanensis]
MAKQIEFDEQNEEQKAKEAEKSTLQQLKEMEQVPIHIPEDPVNEDDKVVVVGINGVFWPIERGKETMVPKVIAEIYRDSYERTRKVEKRMNSTDKEIK